MQKTKYNTFLSLQELNLQTLCTGSTRICSDPPGILQECSFGQNLVDCPRVDGGSDRTRQTQAESAADLQESGEGTFWQTQAESAADLQESGEGTFWQNP